MSSCQNDNPKTMPSTKEIRRRIKSVKSTRQITRAMEMVSAAKMRKAQMQTLATRAYARYAWELIHNLTSRSDPRAHKLLRQPRQTERQPENPENALLIVMSSNRGLIGGFNNNVTQTAINYAKQFSTCDVFTLGKKSRDSLRKIGLNIVADFEKKDTAAEIMDINALAKLAVEDFVAGKYDRVTIIYMGFISTLLQKPTILELLPLKSDLSPRFSPADYLFEPTVDDVLEHVLPKLTMMQIYQALLETNAAEHSARMVAMKTASDSAGDLVSELTLEYNQIRQSNITKEISEIVSGRLAIEG